MSVQELVAPPRPRLAGGRLYWTLGLGAFGLAFSITTLTFLPVELGHFTGSGTLIALVLGAEGVFALLLSPVIGPWSDTFHTPLGRRRPFMLVALGPMAFCLLLMAFLPNLWTTALVVFAFFFAYYVYEPPYRGLYPDLLPPEVFGRAQGVQHVLRGIALGGALVGGGVLLDGGWASTWHDWYYGLIFPVAIAGGAVMTQAWGLLFKLMPPKHRGAISGLATTTKGVGLIVGPLLAGGAIDLASPYLKSTGGYQVLWPVCALPILAVIPLVAKLMRREASGRAEPGS